MIKLVWDFTSGFSVEQEGRVSNKSLSKLSRSELLDLLYEQEKRLEDLEKENKKLKAEIANRKIKISKVGSIAEASLALTKVFDEAQKAVDRYLDNVQGIVREKQTANYVFPAKQGQPIAVQQVVQQKAPEAKPNVQTPVQQPKPDTTPVGKHAQKAREKTAYVGRHGKGSNGNKK